MTKKSHSAGKQGTAVCRDSGLSSTSCSERDSRTSEAQVAFNLLRLCAYAVELAGGASAGRIVALSLTMSSNVSPIRFGFCGVVQLVRRRKQSPIQSKCRLGRTSVLAACTSLLRLEVFENRRGLS